MIATTHAAHRDGTPLCGSSEDVVGGIVTCPDCLYLKIPPPKASSLRIMPSHRDDEYGQECKGARVAGYVLDLDETHWHCNFCGYVAEVDPS